MLQALMVLGNDILETGSDDESVVPETPQEDSSKGLQTLQIGGLLQMILQDAQTRLVFKAQAIIQSEIRLHAPSEDEIRYPEILIGQCCVSASSPVLTPFRISQIGFKSHQRV